MARDEPFVWRDKARASQADIPPQRGGSARSAPVLSSLAMSALRTVRFWTATLAGCALLALIEASALHLDALRAQRDSRLDLILLERLLADSVWVLMAVVVFAVTDHAAKVELRGRAIAWRFVLLGLALLPVYATSDAIAYVIVTTGDFVTFGDRLRRMAGTSFIWDIFLYVLLAIGCYALFQHERARRHEQERADLKTRLAQAELELLRAQLEPHFLFNALNTISGLVRSGSNDVASGALAELSRLLRYVIEASRHERVPLAWELQFVASYLRLQQIRYGSRLQFTIHNGVTVKGCDVPPLLLQPLIENAVVHGAARTTDPTSIELRVLANESELLVEISNSVDEQDTGAPDTTRVGLHNTRERLQRIYGSSFSFDARREHRGRYCVKLSLPRESACA